MENQEIQERPAKGKDDFYAVASAIARFIETADADLTPGANAPGTGRQTDGSYIT